MSRSIRFFEIIQILRQSEKPIIASALAEKLEVNIRTIYRDIASLQASGIPIQGEAGIGYVMQKGFDLPPLAFSQEELEAISISLSMLGRSGDTGLIKTVDTIRSKISSVLPNDLATISVSSHLASHMVSEWHQIPNSDIEPKIFRDIIREHAEIDITYIDIDENKTTRSLKPIALFYYVDAILLVAWCKLRNDFRHFRIDRIQSVKRNGVYFASEIKFLQDEWEASRKGALL